jgi:hypothetical protein
MPDSNSKRHPAVSSADAGPALFFDGACPICSFYVDRVVKPNCNLPIRIIDLRDGNLVTNTDLAQFDPEDGFILIDNQGAHVGAACVNVLAPNLRGLVGTLHTILSKRQTALTHIYSALKVLRKLLLILLGIRPLSIDKN